MAIRHQNSDLFMAIAVVTSVLLLCFTYHQFVFKVISTRRLPPNRSAEHRTLRIWPRSSSDTEPGRFLNQLRFIEEFAKTLRPTRNKTIFYQPHKHYGPAFLDIENAFDSCQVKLCRLTMNRFALPYADAVFFEGIHRSQIDWMLPKPKDQIWIVFWIESPVYSRRFNITNPRGLNGLINWTMSYRPDSTILIPYGFFQSFDNSTGIQDIPSTTSHSGKKKTVAWIVSNCNPDSRRQKYVEQLSKHMDVDVYGRCGNLTCSRQQCETYLRRDYKFYLAFENSRCTHYITEKFFRSLKYGILPVVLGAPKEIYLQVAPPGSFIHADDFKTTRLLAEYLNSMINNATLYGGYFRWTSIGRILEPDHQQRLCQVCALLHANDRLNYVHWYEDFEQWWGEDVCR